jgi:hypothetical protein
VRFSGATSEGWLPWEEKWMIARIMAIASLAALLAAPAAPIRAASLDALVRAYPDQLASHDETDLVWRDGARQKVSDGKPDKSFDEVPQFRVF